jgi:hypothetical protein
LDRDANIEHQTKGRQQAANKWWMDSTTCCSQKNHVDLVHMLLDCGANIEHQARGGWTALFIATKCMKDGSTTLLSVITNIFLDLA